MIYVLKSNYTERLFKGIMHKIKWLDLNMLYARHIDIDLLVVDSVYAPLSNDTKTLLDAYNLVWLTTDPDMADHRQVSIFNSQEAILKTIFGDHTSINLWVLPISHGSFYEHYKRITDHMEKQSILITFDPYSDLLETVETESLISCYKSIQDETFDMQAFNQKYISYHMKLGCHLLAVKLSTKEFIDLEAETVRVICDYLSKEYHLSIICYDIKKSFEWSLLNTVDTVYTYNTNTENLSMLTKKEVIDFDTL